MNRLQSLALGAGLLLSAAVHALEYPIGTPHNIAGMEIAAVYLQPIDMEPEGHMRKAAETDIHLEADIHALAKAFAIPLVDRKAGPHQSVVLIDGKLVPQAELVPLLTPLAARIARLEARLEEQDVALRRVLTLMVDFIENEESRVPQRGTAA